MEWPESVGTLAHGSSLVPFWYLVFKVSHFGDVTLWLLVGWVLDANVGCCVGLFLSLALTSFLDRLQLGL